MPTYTVKKGDTLSGIARNLGLGSYTQLTGYRSGNPNLIFPGEVLSYGGGSPAPAPAAPAPAAPAGPSAAQQAETRWLNEGNTQYNNLTAFDKAAKSPLDIYNAALESLGISDARTRVSNLKTQLMNTENMLRNVDSNVTARTSGSLVTEAQRQRISAQEQAPIAEQVRIEGRNLENAAGDYQMILGEGKTKADLEYKGQVDKRQAIIDRLNIAKDNAKTATEKVKWEKEIQLQEQKMAQEKAQWEAEHALRVQEAQRAAARSSGGGGGGGGGGDSSATTNQQKFASALAAAAGGDGKVSPGDYNALKNQWVSAGYGSYADFHNKFWNFANASHWWDYK